MLVALCLLVTLYFTPFKAPAPSSPNVLTATILYICYERDMLCVQGLFCYSYRDDEDVYIIHNTALAVSLLLGFSSGTTYDRAVFSCLRRSFTLLEACLHVPAHRLASRNG